MATFRPIDGVDVAGEVAKTGFSITNILKYNRDIYTLIIV
jgi:hypothetical protein